jgi:hypothetical protein
MAQQVQPVWNLPTDISKLLEHLCSDVPANRVTPPIPFALEIELVNDKSVTRDQALHREEVCSGDHRLPRRRRSSALSDLVLRRCFVVKGVNFRTARSIETDVNALVIHLCPTDL